MQLQSENTKLEELTPEDLRKSYRENEDIRKNFEEERVSMDQERRAYKRQIDDLRRQLKEKQEKLQESLDKKTKKEETVSLSSIYVHNVLIIEEPDCKSY